MKTYWLLGERETPSSPNLLSQVSANVPQIMTTSTEESSQQQQPPPTTINNHSLSSKTNNTSATSASKRVTMARFEDELSNGAVVNSDVTDFDEEREPLAGNGTPHIL